MPENYTLIMPCYNESLYLRESLERAINQLQTFNLDFNIIVVNDGSTDDTGKIVMMAQERYGRLLQLIELPHNQGKGVAVKKGVEQASGEYIFFTDGDLPYNLKAVLIGLDCLRNKNKDIVIGARDLHESVYRQTSNIIRKISRKIFSLLVHLITGLDIKDTQCGFKGFTREVAQVIFSHLTEPGFAFDVELLVIGKHLKLNIQKIPVEHTPSLSSSSIRLIRDSIKMFLSLLRIRVKWGKVCRS